MTLSAAIDARIGALHLEVSLEVDDGEVVAVLGPNGAGKTSLLRSLLGLVALDAGHVRVGDTVYDDVALRTWVPTERRSIGMVFQDYLLFEHLSVLENVAFGLRATGRRRVAARRRAMEWLERVELDEFASVLPVDLSGGQRQRVALVRALAADPKVLLLDEPFAALDASSRSEIRGELRRFLDGFAGPTILVTHDLLDAHALASRAMVIESGRVTQQGTLSELRDQPRSTYCAALFGVNLLPGIASGHSIELADGFIITSAESAHGAVFATVRPNAIALHASRPSGSARNAARVTVDHIDRRFDVARLRVCGELDLVVEVTIASVEAMDLAEGSSLWASFKATDVAVASA